jgi:cytidylate kinase
MANLIITIDGPAASGKSTVAQLLAKELDASYLDTGAMYRAVTLAAMQAGINMNNERQLLNLLENKQFKFFPKAGEMGASIDGVDVTEQIRSADVTANARYIASAAKVREKLVQMQRQFAAGEEKIVTEGRDQGTVAFADADIKFFLTADETERAKRRQAQLQAKGGSENLEEIRKAIEARDKSDRSRAAGPLTAAGDAITVDTTNLSIEQVVEKLLGYVKEKCSEKF